MSERAYSRIDRATAILGNAWLEREWSEFTGVTQGFVHKGLRRDWIDGKCTEVALSANERAMGLMDFSVVDIDETSGPLGATLTMRRTGGGIQLRTDLTACHHLPALIRQTTLVNLGDAAVTINAFDEENLSLTMKGVAVRHNHFADSTPSHAFDTDERAIALTADDGGWIVGRDGGAQYEAFATAPGQFRIAAREPIVLKGGAVLTLPRSFWLAYTGPLEVASQKLLGEFLMALRQHDKEARERAADMAADE